MLKKGRSLVPNLVRERFGTPPKLRPFLDENAQKLQVSLDAVPGPIAAPSSRSRGVVSTASPAVTRTVGR